MDRPSFQVTTIALHFNDFVGRPKVRQWVKNAYDDAMMVSARPRVKIQNNQDGKLKPQLKLHARRGCVVQETGRCEYGYVGRNNDSRNSVPGS